MRSALHPLQQLAKPWIFTQRIQIRIVVDPIPTSEPGVERLAKDVDRPVRLTFERVEAGNIVFDPSV